MAGNRKKAEAELYRLIDAIQPGNPNVQLYKDYLSKMSDKEFDEWIQRLANKEENISYVCPNFQKGKKINADHLVKMIRSLGKHPYERIWMVDETTEPPTRYLSNDEYPVVKLMLRRQNQLLIKKMSVPKSNNVRDELTGQPTGPESKAASLSFPEIQMLQGKGLDKIIEEQIKIRGGDETAFRAANHLIYNQGGVTSEQIESLDSHVTSTVILSVLMKTMHIELNL